jgi:pimeloyl-ACP methyl ester carboxylesterase
MRIDAGVSLPGEGSLQMALDVFAPDAADLPKSPIVLVCAPGGGMSRRYFDMVAADGDDSFSFARQMTARGFVVVSFDYLGIGESDRPRDGFGLTPEVLTQATLNALRTVLGRLRAGEIDPKLPPLPQLISIGVGHSMGAMMTVLLQAASRQHAAVALLGFGTRGLPEYLSAEVRELAKDPAAVRAKLADLGREMFVEAYPVMKSSPQSATIYGSANADPRGAAAVKLAMQPLLAVPAFMSLLPDNVGPEAAQIAVPVFLGLGELDMAGPPHAIPAAFPGSRDVTLHILPKTGHSHFMFPTRTELFNRIADWARSITTRSDI